ncbi:MAG: hypothetical protein HYU73_16675 [Betaproteobacteria bacterium]|nr:hypothetical protein [Betaproteobacteria bacterium]MBI3054731.1 hypothetical protein [Betaproteobacteria bacterium]
MEARHVCVVQTGYGGLFLLPDRVEPPRRQGRQEVRKEKMRHRVVIMLDAPPGSMRAGLSRSLAFLGVLGVLAVDNE